jgi:hypothetical protein
MIFSNLCSLLQNLQTRQPCGVIPLSESWYWFVYPYGIVHHCSSCIPFCDLWLGHSELVHLEFLFVEGEQECYGNGKETPCSSDIASKSLSVVLAFHPLLR